MEEEIEELKEREGAKVKEIELIKPQPDRWHLKLTTETNEKKIVKRLPGIEIRDVNVDFGVLIPNYIRFIFKKPIPTLFIKRVLLMGKDAIEDVLYFPKQYGFSSTEEAERFLKEKKLLESI